MTRTDPAPSVGTAPTSDVIVDVRNLTYSYGKNGEFQAVKNLSFQVRSGELYALLGTNGAGKTTTLETVEGHRTAASGTVTVFGGSPGDRKTIRPRMGIMLQESGYAADLTVVESLRLAGSVSGREDDADRVVDVVDLRAKRDTRVAQLSGGERRRLDFGSAIWGTPELVFLDEPTTGLDPSAREGLWEVVADLREAGTTVILTTHYLEEAEKYADRIGLMHEGVLNREGTMRELVAGHPSRISFVVPPRVALPLAVSETVNQLAVIETDDLQRDLTILLRWADDAGLRLDQLSANPSSLDDLFRSVTRG